MRAMYNLKNPKVLLFHDIIRRIIWDDVEGLQPFTTLIVCFRHIDSVIYNAVLLL